MRQPDRGQNPSLGACPVADRLPVDADRFHRWDDVLSRENNLVLRWQSLLDVLAGFLASFDQCQRAEIILQKKHPFKLEIQFENKIALTAATWAAIDSSTSTFATLPTRRFGISMYP